MFFEVTSLFRSALIAVMVATLYNVIDADNYCFTSKCKAFNNLQGSLSACFVLNNNHSAEISQYPLLHAMIARQSIGPANRAAKLCY